jgi:hypothetical protein
VANGTRYTGKKIGFGSHSYTRKKRAQEAADRYPVGCTVMAYFNPENPQEAVLVREAPSNVLYMVMGIAMVAFAAGIVIWTSIRAAK